MYTPAYPTTTQRPTGRTRVLKIDLTRKASRTHTCRKCSGEGYVACRVCRGTGTKVDILGLVHTCYDCKNGIAWCSRCRGTGCENS